MFSGEDIQSHGSSTIFKDLKTDPELSPWVDKLCDFMSKSSIDELLPLEEAIVSQSESISSKWKGGNGYVPSTKKGTIDDSTKITNIWAGGGYVKPNSEEKRKELASTISEKFKKPQ